MNTRQPSPLYRPTAGLLALAALGCSEARPPAARSIDAPTVAISAEARPLEELSTDPLFPGRKAPLLPAVARNLPYADPVKDGWETEVRAVQIKDALEGLFRRASGGEEIPAAWLADSFEGVSTLLGDCQDLGGDVPVLAERPGAEDPWAPGREGALGRDVGARLAPPDDYGTLELVSAEVVRLRPAGDDLLETRSRIRMLWRGAKGQAQYNGLWSGRWQTTEDAVWLLSLARHDSEVVRVPERMFADVTESVFGGIPSFRSEGLLDPEAYFFEADRLFEFDMFGNYGLAIGDVDDDGWEDVYSCMPAGIPNRLYLRRPDGTVVDASEEWQANFLDASRSAVLVDMDGDGKRDLVAAAGSNVVVAWSDGQRFASRTLLVSPTTHDVYGISVADGDGDGDLDVFACRYGTGLIAREGGPARVMRSIPTPYYDAFNGARNVYWRNDGKRQLVNGTADAGFDQNNSKFSFAAMWEDYDEDGDEDIYVTNDFGNNHFYRNDGKGHFEDVATQIGAGDQASGMGPSSGDFDLDGDVDIYISNVYAPEGMRITDLANILATEEPSSAMPHSSRLARGNTLYRNNGDGTFEDVSVALGAHRGGWCWGGRFLDVDNDLYEDLYVPNGWYTRGPRDVNDFFWRFVVARSPSDSETTGEYHYAMAAIEHLSLEQGNSWAGWQTNVMLMNEAGERFVDATYVAADPRPIDGRVVSGLDWDRDGRIDLVLKNRTAPRVQLLHNRIGVAGGEDGNGWLVVELEGPPVNRDAIGAQVRVRVGDKHLRRTVYAGDGFLSQNSRRLHFGLGRARRVDEVEVRWPNGEHQRFEQGLEGDRAWRLVQGDPEPQALEWRPMASLGQASDGRMPPREFVRGRMPLCAELPVEPLPVPGFDDPRRTVADFAGGPLLITLWSSKGEVGLGQLRRFAREREALGAAGLAVAPIAIDEGAGLLAARRGAEELGFGALGGFLDGRALQVYEVLLAEIQPRTGRLTLPTSLLVDAQGRLAIVYHGALRVEQVLEDVRLVERSAGRVSDRLLGGLWVQPARRNLKGLAETFDGLSQADLATYYSDLAGKRR